MTTSQTFTTGIATTRPLPGFRELMAVFGKLHCRLFHRSLSRPVAGKYRCWKCLREFAVDW